MAHPATADFSYSDDTELQSLHNQVLADPEEFEHWEKLIRAAESQEGGLNRNSSPQALSATRLVYDGFLARFPLFFGYWKKYADLEFSIAGTEAAELVYERGVASIGISVDLWANYCGFKTETNHDIDMIRELFERGAESVGLDFLAHPFWDKYLEFEERLDAHDRIFEILGRIIHIPLHQYARYFERYRTMAQNRPIIQLAPSHLIAQFSSEIQADGNPKMKDPANAERELRSRIESYHMDLFQRTQAETTKRWTYESEVKRPYYHVTELDEQQLSNWRKYLDFEEAEGDYTRIKFLYERCLVTAANYDEFWLRYARWLLGQGEDKEQDVRSIYQRACCFYIPIAQPAIRLAYANFEEAVGYVSIADQVLDAILALTPSNLEAMLAVVNLHRRQYGVDAAIEQLRKYIDSSEIPSHVSGALVAEWARLVSEVQGRPDDARTIFQGHQQQYVGSRSFWLKWFFFEVNQPASNPAEQKLHYERVKAVYDGIREKSQLASTVIKETTAFYLAYLQERGPQDAMTELVRLDREINGPVSVQKAAGERALEDSKLGTNGVGSAEATESMRNPHSGFYAQQT